MIDKFIMSGVINPQDIEILRDAAQANNKRLVFVDTSYALPGTSEDVFANYQRERIPGAVFFDIDKISDPENHLPHMLPDADFFSAALSDLGLKNDDLLILYAQSGIIMGAARVWWTLRGFGYRDVIILNGGFSAWKKERLPVETEFPKIYPKSDYSCRGFDLNMVCGLSDILEISHTNPAPIVDARPAARFSGNAPEPREGLRRGHIPGSVNIPAGMLVDEKGYLKSAKDLAALFQSKGIIVPSSQKLYLSCGSGVTACTLGLALFSLGHTNFSVYDGSWSEWGAESAGTPVAVNVE